MNGTIIIHTKNDYNLIKLLDLLIKLKLNKNSIFIQSKNSTPWLNQQVVELVKKFSVYNVFPTTKDVVESVVEMVLKSKTRDILILDETSNTINFKSWDENNNDYLLSRKDDLLKLNLDTKYIDLHSFIIDVKSQRLGKKINEIKNDLDLIRYDNKINNELFHEKIIHIDGGLGDHIMALPLVKKLANDVFICCKYPFVYNHLPLKGVISWNDELFGGYKRFVYEYGSANNSKTIIDAFFEMYSEERTKSDILRYDGPVKEIDNFEKNNTILICTSAAKIGGLDSNKDWDDINWFKLVNELKTKGFKVAQIGSKNDNQIPNVDSRILDKSFAELCYAVENCHSWISVDTFFHHFASAVKPEVGICLTPFYNDHAKHPGVKYIEKDCGKDFSGRKWWTDLQQPERKDCMNLIKVDDVLKLYKNDKKKISIYSGDINDNCSNWRCFQQYTGIEDVEIKFKRGFGSKPHEDVHDDIIIVCRPIITCLEYIKFLRTNGVKVIADYDDAFPLLQLGNINFEKSFIEVLEILNNVDLLTTTTERLKYYFSLFTNTKCVVLPNIINSRYIESTKIDNQEKIILGWFGSAGHIISIEPIKDVILKILDEFDNVYLNIYSNNPEIYKLLKHEKTNFFMYELDFLKFQKTVGEIDINLAPILETYINLHKSNIRIILPGYKGIPSVATNFAEYKDLGKENVLLCESNEDWYNNLKLLITNPEIRKKYSDNIKTKINNELVFEKWIEIKVKLFNELV